MATTIVTKYGSDAPAATDIVRGELAVDTENGRLYTENSSGAVVEIGLNPEGNVDVTGTVTADGLTSAGDSAITGSSSGSTVLTLTSNALADTPLMVFQRTGGAVAGKLAYEDTNTAMSFGTTTAHELKFLTSNTERMQIDSSGNITQTSGDFLYSGGGNWDIKHTGASQNIVFSTTPSGGSATQRMRITSAGNVGIGTSNPTKPLHVESSVTNTNTVLVKNTAGTGVNYGLEIAAGTNATDHALHVTSSSGTSLLRVDGSGNVGIGTSSPSVRLDTRLGTTTGKVAEFHNSVGYGIGFTVEGDDGVNTINSESNQALAFATNGASNERMRLDASGNLLVGKTSAGSDTAGFQVLSTGKIAATVSGDETARFNRTTSDGDIVEFRKDDTTVGSIGTTGGDMYVGTGDCAIRFSDGGDQIRVCTNTGSNRDGAIDLGYTDSRFKDIYATNGTIQTSDRNEKQDIEALSDSEQRVAVAAKGLLRKFRWKSSVAEKSDDARTHFGIIAQDLQAAFEAEGLDAGDYAMFINSTWTDEETGEERSRMGVRYSELLAFIIAAI